MEKVSEITKLVQENDWRTIAIVTILIAVIGIIKNLTKRLSMSYFRLGITSLIKRDLRVRRGMRYIILLIVLEIFPIFLLFSIFLNERSTFTKLITGVVLFTAIILVCFAAKNIYNISLQIYPTNKMFRLTPKNLNANSNETLFSFYKTRDNYWVCFRKKEEFLDGTFILIPNDNLTMYKITIQDPPDNFSHVDTLSLNHNRKKLIKKIHTYGLSNEALKDLDKRVEKLKNKFPEQKPRKRFRFLTWFMQELHLTPDETKLLSERLSLPTQAQTIENIETQNEKGKVI